LEITLDGTALVISAERIVNLDIDLWSVESAISVVELPWLAKLDQSIFKCFLSSIPEFVRTETLFRSGGKLELEGEAEDTIDVFEEVERLHHFVHELLWGAEDVSIVLLETTNAGKARQGTGDFVSMQHAKVSQSKRQLSVRSEFVVEHEAVSWTVHWLHSEALVLRLEDEQVIFVLVVVT